MDLKSCIRNIPDYPKPGILFYDISTLIGNAAAWRETVNRLTRAVAAHGPDRLAGIEARGFLVAAPVADRLGLGFTMIRKPGKLPGAVVSERYDLEYGTDAVQIQENAVAPGERVVIVDDLLATGGTFSAASALLRRVGADVRGAVCIIELGALGGRARLGAMPLTSLVHYDD